MGNGENGLCCEFLFDRLLDELISLEINISSSFIQKQNLILFQKDSGQADQLFLSNWKYTGFSSDFGIKLIFQSFHMTLKMDFSENTPDSSVIIFKLAKRVNIVTNATNEHNWSLWDYTDTLSQAIQT